MQDAYAKLETDAKEPKKLSADNEKLRGELDELRREKERLTSELDKVKKEKTAEVEAIKKQATRAMQQLCATIRSMPDCLCNADWPFTQAESQSTQFLELQERHMKLRDEQDKAKGDPKKNK